MHPIERLRYVAREGGLDLVELVQEAAMALAGFADDPAGLVTACRSLVDRHPAAGPVWWLCARVLTAPEPATEAWAVVDEVEADATARTLYREVPDGALVLTVGWPGAVARGLGRRGDCRFLVVNAAGAFGSAVARVLRSGLDVEEVPESGVGAAAAEADLVLIEAQAMGPGTGRSPRPPTPAIAIPAAPHNPGPDGPDGLTGPFVGRPARPTGRGPVGPGEAQPPGGGLVAVSGARGAAAVASACGTPVWAAAPAGRVLPFGLWRVLAARVSDVPEPWLQPDELVPLPLVSAVVRPAGVCSPADAVGAPDCPFAPELVRPLDAPGSHR